ncbi:hypothetical protein ABT095_19755 [Kitasatospora sp. NPDC002227]|uniref:hypothetical protein n=1 Tax=Kitasatospora sp. NPDC002227 TaxID=3154773 RepID=UPI0033244D3F
MSDHEYDQHGDEYEYLPALIAAIADPSAREWTVDGWRIERLGLVRGTAEYGTIGDPLGPESTGFPMRAGGTPVYLVTAQDDPGTPVAALVHPSDTPPVRSDDWGDRVATPSGLIVLHGDSGNTTIGPSGEMLRRTWATLHARAAAEGDDYLLENFRGHLTKVARLDPADWPVEPVEGDFANEWLMLPDEDGTGTVLGILVDPDGSSTTMCLDAEGEPVAALLTFGL